MAYHLTIVGAGLAGRLTALYLTDPARRWAKPLQLRLLDQSAAAGGFQPCAAKAAAAMLCASAESTVLPPTLWPQARQSIQLWRELQQQMPGLWLQQQGCILLAHTSQLEQLQHQVRCIAQNPQASAEPLNSRDLAALEPELAGRFSQGWWCPDDGQTQTESFFSHSSALLQARGVQLQAVSEATLDGSNLSLSGQRQQTDLVLDCRGLGASAAWPELRPVRGEVIRLHCPEVQLRRPVRFYHPRYSLYIAPKPEHQYVVGATELESASQRGPAVRSVLELLSALYAVHPGFAEAEVLSIQASARPTLATAEPEIRQQPGLLQLNGLSRHGYLLGPCYAKQLAELAWQQLHQRPAPQAAPAVQLSATLPQKDSQ